MSSNGGSSVSFHEGDGHLGRDILPTIQPPPFNHHVRREPNEPPAKNFRFDVPPPNVNMRQPPPPIKPENSPSQPTQIRYPKEALNRSEGGMKPPWTNGVSENSFNFGGPVGKQVCLYW